MSPICHPNGLAGGDTKRYPWAGADTDRGCTWSSGEPAARGGEPAARRVLVARWRAFQASVETGARQPAWQACGPSWRTPAGCRWFKRSGSRRRPAPPAPLPISDGGASPSSRRPSVRPWHETRTGRSPARIGRMDRSGSDIRALAMDAVRMARLAAPQAARHREPRVAVRQSPGAEGCKSLPDSQIVRARQLVGQDRVHGPRPEMFSSRVIPTPCSTCSFPATTAMVGPPPRSRSTDRPRAGAVEGHHGGHVRRLMADWARPRPSLWVD
jgi:hypothetical protein